MERAENGNPRQKPPYGVFLQKATKEKPQRLSHLYGLRRVYFYYVEI